MSALKQIAKAVKIAMVEQDITPAELAEKTHFSKQLVTRMLKGVHDFDMAEIATLEDVLGISLLFVPSLTRVITVTMDVDTVSHRGKVRVDVTENGKIKEEWTPAQLVSTANALLMAAQDMTGKAANNMIKPTVEFTDALDIVTDSLDIDKEERPDAYEQIEAIARQFYELGRGSKIGSK